MNVEETAPMGARCGRCKRWLSRDRFNANRSQSRGFSYYCKDCKKATYRKSEASLEKDRIRARETMRRRRVEEPEKVSQEKRRYAERHRERLRAKDRAYYQANAEKRRAAGREYHERNRDRANDRRRSHYREHDGAKSRRESRRANPERDAAVQRAWRAANAERVRAYDRDKRLKRAGAPGRGVTAQQIADLLEAQDGKCRWCGVDVGATFHLDHVLPLARGGAHDIENVVIACPPCNMRKHAKLPEEWLSSA